MGDEFHKRSDKFSADSPGHKQSAEKPSMMINQDSLAIANQNSKASLDSPSKRSSKHKASARKIAPSSSMPGNSRRSGTNNSRKKTDSVDRASSDLIKALEIRIEEMSKKLFGEINRLEAMQEKNHEDNRKR